MMLALRLELVVIIFSGLLALPRGEWLVGAGVRLVGVVDRPAGLHGLCAAFRNFPFERAFVANGEFDRVEVRLDESDALLGFLPADGGKRVEDCDGSGLDVVRASGDVNEGLTPFIVLTLVSAKSLWLRLCPGDDRGLLGLTSSREGVTPRYQAVGEDGETSRLDLLRRCNQVGCKLESDVLRVAACMP
jgi:hypothetical protein